MRAWLVHLAMFVASYALFLTYLLYSSPLQTTVLSSVRVQQTMRKIESTMMSPIARHSNEAEFANPTPSAVAANANRLPSTQYGYPSPGADTSIPPASTLAPDNSSSRAYFNSLDQAVRTDDSSANRIAAVMALRQLASTGDPDGLVLEALRVATQDGDAAVVGVALPAYNEALAMKSVH